MTRKHILSVILSIYMIFALVGLPVAFCEADTAYTDVAILSTTDMHGKCWKTNVLTDEEVRNNMLRVSTAVDSIREEYGSENVLLIDNGDLFQGTPVSEVQLLLYGAGKSSDVPAMALCLKDIGYDAFVLGNHEFNFDWSTMSRIYCWLEENGIPVLAANVTYDGTDSEHDAGENAFTPYVVKTILVNGHPHKIGILGLENTDIPRMDLAVNFPGLQFHHPGNDNSSIAEEVRLYLPQMKEEGCEFMIVAYHAGMGTADWDLVFGVNSTNQGLRLLGETDGIDMLILGHDHSDSYSNTFAPDRGGRDILIVNGGGQKLTRSVFRFSEDSGGALAWELLETRNLNPADYEADEALEALIAPYAEIAEAVVQLPAGTAAGDWDESADYYLRQTDTIDLLNAAMMDIGTKRLAETYDEAPVTVRGVAQLDHLDVDMSVTSVNTHNSYVVHPGDISVKDVYRLCRYSNTMLILPMYGREIRDMMEENAERRFTVRVLDGQVYLYSLYESTNLVFGGLNFSYDMSQPVGQRVRIQSFSNGRDFEDETIYLVAVNSYILGNRYCGLRDFSEKDCIWSQLGEDDGETIQDVVTEYIVDQCEEDGVITPDQFPWHWSLEYSADPEALPPYAGTPGAVYAKTPETGHRYLIYNESEGCAVAESKSAGSLGSVACEACGDTLPAPVSGDALVFTVQDTGDGSLIITDAEGRFLSRGTGGSLSLSEEMYPDGLSLWMLEPAYGGWNIVSPGAGSGEESRQAVNYYSGRFTTARLTDRRQFIFNFYEIAA